MRVIALILLCFVFQVRADQITGTWLLDGEDSTDGTTLTTAIVNSMLHGSDIGTWSTGYGTDDAEQNEPGNLAYTTIESDAHHDLYTPFYDGSAEYDGAGTRGLKFQHNRNEMIRLEFDTPDAAFSVGFYFNFVGPSVNWSPRDVVLVNDSSGNFLALQIYDQASGDERPYFHCHGQGFGVGNDIYFDRNNWYWVTIYFGSAGQTMRIRFYNAESSYSLVGESTATVTGGTGSFNYINLGIFKYAASSSQSFYFDNIVFSSAGTFPLGPGTGPDQPYWVSPTGAAAWSSAGSATPLSGTACASLTTMNGNLAAGDVVYLRGGNYTTQIDPTTTSPTQESERITLAAYNGESVTLSNIVDYAIDLTGQDYYTVNDIDATLCSEWLLLSGSDHNFFTNCNWSTAINASGEWHNGIRITGSSKYNQFVDCVVKEVGDSSLGSDDGGVITLGSSDSSTDESTHNLWLRCVLARGGHQVVTLYAGYNRFQDCHFYNDPWMNYSGTDYGNRNVLTDGRGTTFNRYNVFDNCTFWRSARPVDSVGVSSMSLRSPNNIVRRCRFVDGSDAGISIVTFSEHTGYSPNGLANSNHVAHNVFVYSGINTGNTDIDQTAGLTLFKSGGTTVEANRIVNNIFWDNVGDRAWGDEPDTLIDLNTFAGNLAETANPMFVDWSTADLAPSNPASHDFNLSAGSPAIDYGSWLTTITSSSGSGTSFAVADPGFFTDGFGIYTGDTIQLQGQTTTLTVTAVDYDTGSLTVTPSATWTVGDGVAFAYVGSAPDAGAFESDYAGTHTRTMNSATLRVTGRLGGP